MATHILVADDDDALWLALQRELVAAGYTVALASDGEEALRLAQTESPDLVVLNLLLPGLPGLEVCRRLWLIDATLPIIPLLDRKAVPDEYLVKPVAGEEVLARIRARLRRRDSPQLLQFADLRLNTATRQAWRSERPIALTTTEYELLRLFLQHPRRVLTRDFLYERVWGHDFEGESKVLEVYIYYLRRKLEAAGEPRLIHTVRGAGYALREAG